MRVKPDMQIITGKAEELCLAILQQPAFKELKQMIHDFIEDDDAIRQYNQVVEKHSELQQKQHQGIRLTQQEIDDFEQERYNLYTNPIIRDFMYAQQEFERVQKLINKYVTKTIDLERIPNEEDLEDGACGCGGSCGCGGH